MHQPKTDTSLCRESGGNADMNLVSRLIVGSLIGLPLTGSAWGLPQQHKHNDLEKPREGRVINAVEGDRACYLTIRNDAGHLIEEFATFEVCERRPSLIGQRVALTYRMGEVNSASCGGEPICSDHDRVPLVTAARILTATKPSRPSAGATGRLCDRDEVVVFSCRTETREVSVCASRDASQARGYVQYRFGRPGKPEMVLPSSRVIPSQAATGAVETYSGGGAAWLRFSHGGYGYVVYTGIGRWGDKGETREVAGVLVEQPKAANRNMNCVGNITSLLGPVWFEKVGIERSHPEETFNLPVP